MSLNVWTYWSGPMPPWVGWCLDSMRRHCKGSTLRVLDERSALEWADRHVLESRWLSLEPGVGTDCLRAAVLATHGGLWLDADTVCLRDPATLLEMYRAEQFVFATWPSRPDRAVAGYVHSPADHPVARQWLAAVQAALEWSEDIGWLRLGEQTLTPIVRSSPRSTWEMQRQIFLPLNISDEPGRLFERSGWRDHCTSETIAFGLNHSWLMAHHDKDMLLPRERMAETGLMIHRLLTEAA